MGDIDPKRLYSFAEACKLIPSTHAGKEGITTQTLQNWRRRGAIQAHKRLGGWFIWGSEILKLFPEPPAEQMRTPAERKRAMQAAEKRLRKRGLIQD